MVMDGEEPQEAAGLADLAALESLAPPALVRAPCAVLIVDDDREIRGAMVDVLAEEGYRVLQARDGRECLRIIAATSCRLVVLLDLMMPGMDGEEVCKRLAANPALRRDHALAVVSARSNLQQVRCPGVDAMLAKPFEVEDLLQLVARLATMMRVVP
jgi:CheY-like chemotaxis protein